MITGKLPFYESEDFRTFQRIIQIDYKLADFVDDEARDLIAKLLVSYHPSVLVYCSRKLWEAYLQIEKARWLSVIGE